MTKDELVIEAIRIFEDPSNRFILRNLEYYTCLDELNAMPYECFPCSEYKNCSECPLIRYEISKILEDGQCGILFNLMFHYMKDNKLHSELWI